MPLLNLLKSYAYVFTATFLLILVSNFFALSAFASAPWTHLLAMAAFISALAWLIYLALILSVSTVLQLKEPGFALATVFGVVSGATALKITSILFAGAIGLLSLTALAAVALLNTLLVWLLAFATGTLRKELSFLPKR